MDETPAWPPYPIGPRDSIFAMGVVSINFAELEHEFIFMFATVLGVEHDIAKQIVSKTGSGPCLQLMMQILETSGLPETAKSHVRYFADALSVCMENRNHLMHSNIAWLASMYADGGTVPFKTSKQGNTITATLKVEELRRVADEMHAYSMFGRQLANAINNTLGETPIFPSTPGSAFPWPDRPPPPHTLTDTSTPRQEPTDHQGGSPQRG